MNITALITVVASLATAACAAHSSPSPVQPTPATAPTVAAISRAEVEAAQRGWCQVLLDISATGARGGDARGLAEQVIAKAYDYERGPVLFKPTLAYGERTFRMTADGALSYFVGGDAAYAEDKGFALKGWVTCTPKVHGVMASGAVAMAMGNVHFEDAKGTKVMVDKTFGYRRDAAGDLRIVLHHSSIPYTP